MIPNKFQINSKQNISCSNILYAPLLYRSFSIAQKKQYDWERSYVIWNLFEIYLDKFQSIPSRFQIHFVRFLTGGIYCGWSYHERRERVSSYVSSPRGVYAISQEGQVSIWLGASWFCIAPLCVVALDILYIEMWACWNLWQTLCRDELFVLSPMWQPLASGRQAADEEAYGRGGRMAGREWE